MQEERQLVFVFHVQDYLALFTESHSDTTVICFRELVDFFSSLLELCGIDQLSPHA